MPTNETRNVPVTPSGNLPTKAPQSGRAPGRLMTRRSLLKAGATAGAALTMAYTVAAPDFLCAGGDTYYVFAEAATKTMRTIGYLTSDCLQYYLEEACGGEVPADYADPLGQGRITIVT